ncbi:MAG: hypothetical protein R3Y68_06350 [Rikenellaceae bacterium]
MAAKKAAPESAVNSARASILVDYKGSKKSLSKLQSSLFILLSDGNKYSSHKIMQRCKTSDPRKEVQYLRRKGINVQDEVIKATKEIPRHKRYWIDHEECRTQEGNV